MFWNKLVNFLLLRIDLDYIIRWFIFFFMKQIDQFVVLKCQEQAQLDWRKYTNYYYYYHIWGKKIKAFWQTSSGQYSTSKLLTLKSKNGPFSKAQPNQSNPTRPNPQLYRLGWSCWDILCVRLGWVDFFQFIPCAGWVGLYTIWRVDLQNIYCF